MSCELSSVFNSDVGSPHAAEFRSSSWLEAVISSDWSWAIVRWSSGNLGAGEGIVGKEGSLEFSGVESSISTCIVSSDKKFNFFVGYEDADCLKSAVKFAGRDSSVSVGVEDVESISEVKVVASAEANLGSLKILLVAAEILEGVDELILIVWSKNWGS